MRDLDISTFFARHLFSRIIIDIYLILIDILSLLLRLYFKSLNILRYKVDTLRKEDEFKTRFRDFKVFRLENLVEVRLSESKLDAIKTGF